MRFEAAWDAYQIRLALETIESERKGMVYALYANGMIEGKALSREIGSINANADRKRVEVLQAAGILTDELIGEDEFSDEPPIPTKVSDDGG